MIVAVYILCMYVYNAYVPILYMYICVYICMCVICSSSVNPPSKYRPTICIFDMILMCLSLSGAVSLLYSSTTTITATTTVAVGAVAATTCLLYSCRVTTMNKLYQISISRLSVVAYTTIPTDWLFDVTIYFFLLFNHTYSYIHANWNMYI